MKKILFYTLLIFANTASASRLTCNETFETVIDLPSTSQKAPEEFKLSSEEIYVTSSLLESHPLSSKVSRLIEALKHKYGECYNAIRNDEKISPKELMQFLKDYEKNELFQIINSLTMLPASFVNKKDNVIYPEVSKFKLVRESIYHKTIKSSVVYLLQNADRAVLLNGQLRVMGEVKSYRTKSARNGEVGTGEKRKRLDAELFSDPTPFFKKSKNSE